MMEALRLLWSRFAESSVQLFEKMQTVSHKILAPIFNPMNDFLGGLPEWVASVFGVGIFVMAMVWVGVFLNKDYVNRGRPYKSIWTDLRLWTCLSMMPHVIFYLYFR